MEHSLPQGHFPQETTLAWRQESEREALPDLGEGGAVLGSQEGSGSGAEAGWVVQRAEGQQSHETRGWDSRPGDRQPGVLTPGSFPPPPCACSSECWGPSVTLMGAGRGFTQLNSTAHTREVPTVCWQ